MSFVRSALAYLFPNISLPVNFPFCGRSLPVLFTFFALFRAPFCPLCTCSLPVLFLFSARSLSYSTRSLSYSTRSLPVLWPFCEPNLCALYGHALAVLCPLSACSLLARSLPVLPIFCTFSARCLPILNLFSFNSLPVVYPVNSKTLQVFCLFCTRSLPDDVRVLCV